jgi:hypothetical protein
MVRVYIGKVICELIAIPFTCWISGVLKNKEKMDIYDTKTNFNPFSLDVSYTSANNLRSQEEVRQNHSNNTVASKNGVSTLYS